MKDWERGNLKAFVEMGGAVIVLIGLAFVGLELRQNTAAVEAATFQSLTDASSNFLLTIASDSDLMRAWSIGSSNLDQLDEMDSGRHFLLRRSYWVRMQNVFSQWDRGTLSDEDWRLYNAVICDFSDGNRATFDKHREILSPQFIEFIQSCW